MANPGPYPMNPPMGGPMQPPGGPMGGPPGPPGMGPGSMGPMGMRPMRQGTSRVVPVVVSAGLAVGVFCGLLFGLGTAKHSAAAPQKASNGAKQADDSFTPESLANPNVKLEKNAPKAGAGSAVAGAGSNGSDSAAAGSAEPAIKTTKLVVELKPDTAAQGAKVLVDGKEITGTTAEIPLDPGETKKEVRVVVKAQGYKEIEQKIELEGESTTLKLELIKGRSGQSATAQGDGATPSSGTAAGGTPSGSHPASAGGVPTGEKSTGGDKSTGGEKSGSKPPANKNTTKPKANKGSGGLIDI
jgi:hypothetical protein